MAVIANNLVTPQPQTEAQAAAQAQEAARLAIAEEKAEVTEYQPQLITAYQTSSMYTLRGIPRYNPDNLVGRKGLRVYSDMMNDEQVKAVMNFRRDAVTARAWTLRFEEGCDLPEEEQASRVSLMTRLINEMDGSFVDALNAILRAMIYGYSVTEKIYDYCEVEGLNYYYVAQVQAKPLDTFWFECDAYGRITKFYQLLGGVKNELDLEKFIVMVHNPEEDNVFGRSELRAAYRSWYSKDVIIKFWNLWMERMAGGFLAVTRDPAVQTVVPGSPEYAALQKALSSITTTTSMLLPAGFTPQLITPGNTDQYEAALSWHDRAIAKSQLVPNLLGVSDQGAHGALAQSTTQLEAFAWTLANISRRLEDCVNSQFLYELCEKNFGDGEYPSFAFSAVTDAQLQWIITSWKDLVGAKSMHVTPKDEAHIRKILDFPPITEEEIQAADEKAKADTIEIAQASRPAPGASQGSAFGRRGARSTAHPHGKPRTVSLDTFTRAAARVDFAVIDNSLKRIERDRVKDLAKETARALSRLLTDERLTFILKDDITHIAHVEFDGTDKGRIKQVCRDALQAAWSLGREEAQREMAKARKKPFKRTFANTLSDAIKLLDTTSFRMAGDLTDTARRIISTQLIQAVKGNKSVGETRDAIIEAFIKKGLTDVGSMGDYLASDQRAVLEALQAEGYKGDDSSYLDTMIKTTTFDAMNQARLDSFRDPDLGDFVSALEYSAILDDHTTEICTELNGSTWRTDNPLWDTYNPPNHFNCRSVVIPVTTLDGWDGEEDPAPSVQPQEGFK